MKDLAGEVAGPLLIGASMTIADYLLPQVLGEFNVRFPSAVPRLLVANSETVQNGLAEHSLDIGFIEGASLLPSLLTETCCEDELLVVCAPGHPLAREAWVTPDLLVQHAYVSREPGSGTREVAVDYLQKFGITPDSLQPVMELGSPEALKGLVATGFGFAIMSRATVTKEVRLGKRRDTLLSTHGAQPFRRVSEAELPLQDSGELHRLRQGTPGRALGERQHARGTEGLSGRLVRRPDRAAYRSCGRGPSGYEADASIQYA